MRNTATTHLTELDGMRGVLACAVMVFHLGLNTLIAKLTGGRIHDGQWPLAVDFFFLLSGFVLSLSYSRRPAGLGPFVRKRFARLAPMFLLTTLAMIPLTAGLSGGTLAANLLMLQPFLGLPSINMPSWSVPLEMWLPLVAVALAPVLPAAGRNTLKLGLVMALIAQCAATFALANGADLPVLRAASGLAAGAFMQRLYVPRSGRTGLALGFFVAGVAVMALAGVAPILAAAFPLCAAGAIWFGAQAKGLFSTAPMQALGRWSFSIYLLHIPVLVLTEKLVGGLEGAITIKAAILVAVLALAGLCYRFIEAPCMALGRPRTIATA